MRKVIFILFIALFYPVMIIAQPLKKREQYDISKDKVLYTVGYAHLDSEWNWDYPATINMDIKNTMLENFHLFEKYPDYVFNFTGSRRYQMMKEYYPELYKKVQQYVHDGRWYVSGSSVDEGEVNISSSESLIRQVLYGNDYFRKEFGVESKDYMLPDCFGFLANLPTIWNHCGLLGFSTQKLTWRSAAGIPFNVGVWNGPDDKGIVAAFNATNYNGGVKPRLDIDSAWVARLDEDKAKYGISFDYRYYGVGDEGGAPRERDVKNVIESLHNSDSQIKVILTSSDQMYKDITPEIREKLPTYKGDLLLIEHSAGSMTSQAYMKRLNRKNELLAKSAEQLAVMADWTSDVKYPFEKINNSWDLVLGSQFHDILPGTSIPKAYEYAWNDEFIAANGFQEVLKSSVSELTSQLNTQVKGKAVVVYNPVASNREDVVTAEISYETLPANVQVYDEKGKAVPTQVVERKDKSLKVIFLAKVQSVGMSVYDVRETTKQASKSSTLVAGDKLLENEYYKVKFADNGDMLSVFDKKAGKELLAKPARLEFLAESPAEWPAWNMDWEDRQNAPIDYMDKEASIKVIEEGAVRVALEIKRKGQNSEITQVVSLSAGDAGKRVEVDNKVDWQSTGVSLKAAFPLTVSNKQATYNLGVGTLQRANNDSVKFEVPAKQWFDLTNEAGDYGVTILEDCKYGSDKPADNMLRLTLLYTPEAKRSFRYQDSQDWGEQEFRYGIYGHKGSWVDGQSQWQGEFFNQPLLAFEAPKHAGKLGKATSFLSVDTPKAGVMAVKKMENDDYYIVRVNELSGSDLSKVNLKFAGNIADAFEVNGQEQKIGQAGFANNQLSFDLSHYTIRTFAVKLADAKVTSPTIMQEPVPLDFDQDVMSFDDNRWDGSLGRGGSLPAELVPDEITSEGIRFAMGSRADEANNAISCKGQKISLPEGDYTSLYILASAVRETTADFKLGDVSTSLNIQGWTGYIGQHYNRNFDLDGRTVLSIDKPFLKQDNIAWFASHCHRAYPTQNVAYQYCYLYKYELKIPAGAKTITLPDDDRIRILAMTVANGVESDVKPLQPLFDDFADSPKVELRTPAVASK
ncbi:alpha-mannosidase [Gaoshiqia sediminis]|uniref:Alpha-mannosidase n=1 Tax=Gaoshiqia sediminis TaxID=2986998 RepID=A0AA41Y9Q8_9BACT|nr:glycoside hydrolase family 38 C-terminal domain-containing protein [Gaoshiqia sediminis]MCW0483877.1 alpha-mannosidase [Gaoshiqia sediminis]